MPSAAPRLAGRGGRGICKAAVPEHLPGSEGLHQCSGSAADEGLSDPCSSAIGAGTLACWCCCHIGSGLAELLVWLDLLCGAQPRRQHLVLVAALQLFGGYGREARAWVQSGGDLHGVLGVDGVDGLDPKGLGPVKEHGEGAGRAVGGDGEEGHGPQLLVPCW